MRAKRVNAVLGRPPCLFVRVYRKWEGGKVRVNSFIDITRRQCLCFLEFAVIVEQ